MKVNFNKTCMEAKTEFVVKDVSYVQATLEGQFQPLVAGREEQRRNGQNSRGATVAMQATSEGAWTRGLAFGSDEKWVYFENCFGLKMDLFLNLLMNQTHAMSK